MKKLSFPAIVVAMIAIAIFLNPKYHYTLAASESFSEVDSLCIDGGVLDTAYCYGRPESGGEHPGYTKEEVKVLTSSTTTRNNGWSVTGGINGGGSGFGGSLGGGYTGGSSTTETYVSIMCCMPKVGARCNFDYENARCDELYQP